MREKLGQGEFGGVRGWVMGDQQWRSAATGAIYR